MEFLPTILEGCYEVQPRVFADDRGTFVKTFHEEMFAKKGLANVFKEQFYSVSRKGVLRGMHFQTPPMDHAKLVTCLRGEVMDVVVDLRKGSSTFRNHAVFYLSSVKGNMVYIPTGMAHGFYTLSDDAILLYNTTTMHSPTNDAGIRWDSAGIAWPVTTPILSPRDAAFPALSDFLSPF